MYHNIISIILGLEGCEITWSQTIQFHLYVTHSIWRGVKLQGAQTDIHYIVKSFKVWKGVKLQGTQTSKNQRAAVL